MFHLTKDELERAKGAIEHHGYGIFFPHPTEWKCVSEHWEKILNPSGRLGPRCLSASRAPAESRTKVADQSSPCGAPPSVRPIDIYGFGLDRS